MTPEYEAQMREMFEAWCDRNEYDRMLRMDGSGYNNDATRRAWAAWLATDRAQADARPLFYYRPVGEDGLYEGPVHADSVGGKLLREEKPGEWKPLYTHPPEASAPGLLEELAKWLHAAYDRPPQTPECRAMLKRVDAAIRASAATVAEPSEDDMSVDDLINLAEQLQIAYVKKVLADMDAIAKDHIAPYWAGYRNSIQEMRTRLEMPAIERIAATPTQQEGV